MKKFLAIFAMLVSGSVFAASATVEGQSISGQNGTADQAQYSLSVKENINKNFAGDAQFSQTTNDGNPDKLSSTRIEGGLTGTLPATSFADFYTRVAVGQKYTSSTNYGYYSVEPGFVVPLGAGFTAKAGYRFRSAFDNAQPDTTRTWRAGVGYQITQKDAVGVRYDQVRGDSQQNIWAVNYTRSF
jgi:hypothetical protein